MAIRVQPTHTVVLDQVDFFQGDFYTRIAGLGTGNVALVAFYGNTPLAWPLVSGVGVTDAQVVAGSVYFHELQAGYYGLRFRPNVSGYWRLIFNYAAGTQSVTLDYDILDPITLASGLKASFVKPG